MREIVNRLFDNRRLYEARSTTAWHLRQDGKSFPVKVHMYCMGDEDLSSEAEVAAFLIKTDSDDQELAEYVLDAWMAFMIENSVSYDAVEDDIEESIREELKKLPYKFQYDLSEDELIQIHKKCKNYSDVDSLYDFIDLVRDGLTNLQDRIKKSINQQFCRVRYGGKYDTNAGDSEIWFRISSEGYNWVNTIYIFVSNIYRGLKISHITICRDNESDDSEVDYFYRAKDGTYYKHLPINEYLEEEHEHNPVFESFYIPPRNIGRGVLSTMWNMLREGYTYERINECMQEEDLVYQRDSRKYFLNKERKLHCKRES